MTKQQRKEIYWAAMFEMVAFNTSFWGALDSLFGFIVTWKDVPEVKIVDVKISSLQRLSKAIHKCEQSK